MRTILLSGLCALFLLVSVRPAYAANSVELAQQINLTIVAEGNVSFNINLQLQNNTTQVLRELTLPLLAANPGPVTATQSGNGIAASTNLIAGEIKLNLQRLLPGEKASLNVNYSSSRLARESAGTYALYLPPIKQSSSLTTTTKWQVDPDNTIPPLLYASKDEVNNFGRRIEWTGNEQMFLIFGELTNRLTINQSLATNAGEISGGEYLVNLPYQWENSNVEFNILPGADAYSSNSTGNVFLRLPNNAQLAFSMDRQLESRLVIPNQFTFIKSPGISWQANLNENLPQQAHKLVVDRLNPARPEETSSFSDLRNVGREFIEPEKTFTSLEYATLMNEYLQHEGVASRVVYGYVIGFDSHPLRDLSGPLAWVEVLQGERVFIYNPYLADLLQIRGEQLPQALHVQMGIFNINAEYDTALGLASENSLLVPRPNIVKTTKENVAKRELGEQQLNAVIIPPQEIPEGWTSYRPSIVLTNNSGRILSIRSIKVDGLENIGSLVLAQDLYPAVLPAQQSSLRPLVWVPNILGGNSEHSLDVEAKADNGAVISKSVTFQLPVTTNVPLLMIFILIALMVFAGWLLFMRRLRLLGR